MITVSNSGTTGKDMQTFSGKNKTKVALPECTMIITECVNELWYLPREHSVIKKSNEVAVYTDLEADL